MAARCNNSSKATYQKHDLDYPFAQGAFRYVAKGVYTEGERKGQTSVCKWFKSGLVFEDTFFRHDINAVDKALEIVNRFNQGKHIDKCIKINMPEV